MDRRIQLRTQLYAFNHVADKLCIVQNRQPAFNTCFQLNTACLGNVFCGVRAQFTLLLNRFEKFYELLMYPWWCTIGIFFDVLHKLPLGIFCENTIDVSNGRFSNLVQKTKAINIYIYIYIYNDIFSVCFQKTLKSHTLNHIRPMAFRLGSQTWNSLTSLPISSLGYAAVTIIVRSMCLFVLVWFGIDRLPRGPFTYMDQI